MRHFILLLIIINNFVCCTTQKKNYNEELQQYQYKMNTDFADASSSPLTEKDLKTFKSLDFFPINEKYNVEATIELTPNEPVFEMKTTSDRLPLYKKYGIATFQIDGKKFQLNLFQNQQLLDSPEYGSLLFVPFYDQTNSNTTYGGGRYLDIEIPKKGKTTIMLDFNKAYNPYCAYNESFSCPIPPKENSLQISIEAGVKKFKLH